MFCTNLCTREGGVSQGWRSSFGDRLIARYRIFVNHRPNAMLASLRIWLDDGRACPTLPFALC